MIEHTNKLLQKEVTRKEFLQCVAGGLIFVFGFHNLLSLLQRYRQADQVQPHQTDALSGFGTRKFGA